VYRTLQPAPCGCESDHVRSGRSGGSPCHGSRRRGPLRHRFHRTWHDNPGSGVSEYRVPGPGAPRHRGPPAIQVEAACTGFIYALSIADKFIRLSEGEVRLGHRRGMSQPIGGLERSRHVRAVRRWRRRGRPRAFRATGDPSTHLHANGAYADLLFYPTGPSRLHHAGVSRQNAIHMQGAEVFKEAVASWRESSRRPRDSLKN